MSDNATSDQQAQPAPKVSGEHFKKRKVSLSEVRAAKKIAAAIEAGAPSVRRFSPFAVAQHFVLLITILVLLVTGLSQTFDNIAQVVAFIKLIGGVDRLQFVHRVFADVLLVLLVIHIVSVSDSTFVRMNPASMFFDRSDARGLARMVRLFFDENAAPPEFGRFKPDEKFIYWLTFFSVLISAFTGLVMWFPVQSATILSGAALPIVNSIHRWQAILLVVTLITLHTYQVLRKRGRVNIFTGLISVTEMQYEHPLEVMWVKRLSQISEDHHFPVIFSGHSQVHSEPAPVVEAPSVDDNATTTENLPHVDVVPVEQGIAEDEAVEDRGEVETAPEAVEVIDADLTDEEAGSVSHEPLETSDTLPGDVVPEELQEESANKPKESSDDVESSK